MNNIYAGGIVPYVKNGNEPIFLLGQEKYNKKWCGFIGKYEPSDGNIVNTALREFNEETAKVFENYLDFIHTKIITGDCTLLVDNNNGKLIYIWFIKFPMEMTTNIENIFLNNVSLMTDTHYQEKSSIKWFSLQEIKISKNEILYKLKKTIMKIKSFK